MALAAGTGPVLDAGAGSAVFTAEAYVRSSRPLLLVDRSQGMLRAAQERLTQAAGGAFPLHVTLLQGTIETLPLQSGSVDTVVSMGVLHLFEDVEHWLNPLLRMGSEGGMLFATSLVAERVVGRLYLRLLHATGEVATPRSYDGLRRKLSVVLDADVDVTREGSMAFVSARMG